MRARVWLQRPRHLLLAFLAVAVCSTGALGWLAWELLQQDAALDAQRRQEALEQAADNAVAIMQRAVTELQSIAAAGLTSAARPALVSLVALRADGVDVSADAKLPFLPITSGGALPPSAPFIEGERLEFTVGDLRAAAGVYAGLTDSLRPDVSAGALARLARVQRKLDNLDAALRTYERLLGKSDSERVAGLPATLVARAGRAAVLEQAGQIRELQAEAKALGDDLHRARWRLAKSEYDYYAGEVARWLGQPLPRDDDTVTRAEALQWLWDQRHSFEPAGSRAIPLAHGSALLTWTSAADGLHAVIAGPLYLSRLREESGRRGVTVSLMDIEGQTLAGDPAPAGRRTVVRTAAAARLPWTLEVDAVDTPTASPRRPLLTLVFVALAFVLTAGWYFILHAMSRELRVARLQNEFVGAVSHEFRSPLASLSHIAEMLAQNRVPPALRQQSFDVLVRDASRLRRLVEDLLDFGRYDAGAAVLRLEPLDMAVLVREVTADFQECVAAQGYAIEVACPPHALPARGDREALTRALWNLLDNAVKYSPESPRVWVSVGCEEGRIAVGVRDEGLGIPAHEQRAIFQRFVRGAESTRRRIRGTGIGLALVRHIAGAHGGEVRVASEPGAGTTFTLLLPPASAV
jgi:signal transduction histidine kinase